MKKQKNPFTLSFGRKPEKYITRIAQKEQILDTFTQPPVTDQVFIIMGIRGSGKTVLLSDISKELDGQEDWVVIRISPEEKITEALFADLCHNEKIHKVFTRLSFSLSALGIGISAENNAPEMNAADGIDKILSWMDSHGMKLLVAIDEVTSTAQMRQFASVFQILTGKEHNIFFLATGLYDQIMNLQNEPNMTFLYRAPKIILEPLDLKSEADVYESVFDITEFEALRMAKLTSGYSYAFQVLGYIYWNKKPEQKLNDLIGEYDRMLREFSYSKLWSESSAQDKNVMYAIADHNGEKVGTIRDSIGMKSSLFNAYRTRLMNRGLIYSNHYGALAFTLPRFKEFVKLQRELEEA